MPNLIEQVAQPRIDFTSYSPIKKTFQYPNHPAHYDNCQDCGGLKSKRSRKCIMCKYAAAKPPIDPHTVLVEGDLCRRIPLTQNLYAIVDVDQYERFMNMWWSACKLHNNLYYPMTHINIGASRLQIAMHRFVVSVPDGMVGDHRNGNPLDNRRGNLRPATHKQNSHNAGKHPHMGQFKGVYKREWMGKTIYGSRITYCGKHITLAWFNTEIEAAVCYDKVAYAMRGDWARLNFPHKDDVRLVGVMLSPVFPLLTDA